MRANLQRQQRKLKEEHTKLGKLDECQRRITQLENNLQTAFEENDNLTISNSKIHSKNQDLEKRLNESAKELEIIKLKDQKPDYSSSKYRHFLLDIQNAFSHLEAGYADSEVHPLLISSLKELQSDFVMQQILKSITFSEKMTIDSKHSRYKEACEKFQAYMKFLSIDLQKHIGWGKSKVSKYQDGMFKKSNA